MTEHYPGKPDSDKVPNAPGVWYWTEWHECVLCGRSDTYKERRPPPKPEAWSERYSYHQYACDWHFM